MSVPAAAEACAACGAPADDCRCARLIESLRGRAAALQRAGMAAARDGELHRALALLRRASRLAAPEPDAARVLSLVALCLGEAGAAARAWRGVGTDEPAPLERDGVREALSLYNQALAEAHGGDGEVAASLANEALERLPDLLPAHRLRALLAAERGDVTTARAACEAGLAICSDDLPLQRWLANLPASDAPVPIAAPDLIASDPPAPVAAPSSSSPPRARATLPLAAAWAGSVLITIFLTYRLGYRAGADLPQANASSPVVAPAPASAPAPAIPLPPARMAALAAPFDFAAYRRGRDAFDRGDWQRAATELSGAATVPADAYYRDDALYLLARAQARAARPGEARGTAALLLRDHPESIFANRITRRIAERGTE
ncbi:MAG TPA: hypothetical protein VF092_27920 [Longimicrobium sp.]